MSQYVNIPLPEMRDFLKSDKGWKEEIQSKEVVFSFPLKKYPQIVIKVYSGIACDSQLSRAKGADAIRVCSVNIKTHLGFIKAARVYRVVGWRNNLKERVLQVIKQSHGRIKQYGAN
jgi:hypothetical protein